MAKQTGKPSLKAKFSAAASTNSGRVHIVPSKDGWAVKREGAKKATVVTSTKASAITAAANIKSASRVVVHKKDGTIQSHSKR